MLAIKSTEKLAPAKPSLGTDHEAPPEAVARLENRARGPVNSVFDYMGPCFFFFAGDVRVLVERVLFVVWLRPDWVVNPG